MLGELASASAPASPKAGRKSRRRPKDLWIRLHLYVGLWFGLLFAVLGLTGSYNVYSHELDRLLNPSLYAPEQGRPSLPFSQLIDAAARKAAPDAKFSVVAVRLAMPSTALIGFTNDDPEIVENIYVERSTGRHLGTRFQGGSFSEFILHLHAYFYLDSFTTRATGVLGILLLFSVGSGLYIWWPKGSLSGNLKVHFSGSRRRLYFELHRTAGTIAALLLLISCITGLSLVFPEPFVAAAGPADVQVAPTKAASGPASLDQAVKMAEALYPAMHVRWVDMVGDPPEYRIILRNYGDWVLQSPDRRVWVDQASGRIVRVRDPSNLTAGATVLEWFWPLHAGQALGPAGRMLIFIGGLMPALLFLTGLRLWILRRRRLAP